MDPGVAGRRATSRSSKICIQSATRHFMAASPQFVACALLVTATARTLALDHRPSA
jgi:hypothetical protein